MDKLDMKTSDLIDENIGKIAKLFPNVITEKEGDDGNTVKAIDFDLLRQELSKELVEDDNERYRLDWPGKKASLLKANTPIDKTLRPDREASVNFDKTENFYIEGDNFEVLKILQESYLGKVKMIYIDPPYNTGKDFVYRDNTTQSKEEYEEELGVEDEDGGKLFKNTDTNGRFHSDWLSMMYERLVVARDLLKDDGVIFMSIDDNEVHNLRKIGDEIFGEENFVGEFIRKTKSMTADEGTGSNNQHENLLVFSKSKDDLFLKGNKKSYSNYSNPDNDSMGEWTLGDPSAKSGGNTTYFEIKNPYTNKIDLPPNGRYWAFSRKSFQSYIEKGKIVFRKSHKNNERGFTFKRYKKELKDECDPVSSLDFIDNIYMNQVGTKELKELFNNEFFENPKPISFLRKIVKISTNKNDLIFDFFSGSATTAHAVMQLNANDGGNRKFIMAQLPEKTDEKSEAFKAGYKTISKIGIERIRRAGTKIVNDELSIINEEIKKNDDKLENVKVKGDDGEIEKLEKEKLIINNSQLTIKNLDIGFRVYKTDSTNMKDVFYSPAELKQEQLSTLEKNIKEDRTPEDLLTQVILNLGLMLDLPIEKKKIKSNTVFFVANNSLVACFDNNIDFGIVDEIAKSEPLKVVFRDSCFKDDKDRINVENRFKRLSPETIISVL